MNIAPIGFSAALRKTDQEVVDFVFKALWEQNDISFNKKHRTCMYINKKTGCKCAVGLMLNPDELDEVVRNESNTKGISKIWNRFDANSFFSDTAARDRRFLLIRSLQHIHDNYALDKQLRVVPFREYLKDEFLKLAQKHNLDETNIRSMS